MATLPDRPDLDQLRSRARDLLNAARAGDATARHRVRAVSDRVTLSGAQLAIAREYGFASWSKLKTEVEDRRRSLAELADEFCAASVRDRTGRAARLLASHPELAGYSVTTAIILGDAERVRAAIRRDPGQATRPDTRTGWTALHAVAASRWHRLDPARADGLLAVARLLLDAGADPSAVVSLRADQPGGWTPLRCAVAGGVDLPIVRLLLSRGARPEDHDLYLAGFADDDHECLRVLLDHAGDLSGTAEMALAAPISTNDLEGVRLLLDAGADPRRFVTDNPPPAPVIHASVQAGCSSEIVNLLLIHGADPDAPGPDGLAPITVATRRGRSDLLAVLRGHGAIDTVDDLDRFLGALVSGDAAAVRGLVQADSSLPTRLAGAQQGEALVKAAEAGGTDALRIMLDLGFPVDVSGGDDGGTALHAAAYAGAASAVTLLLDRGADIEARDTTWHSTPLVWAAIGSGEHPTTCPDPDWLTTVRTLLAAGASTGDMTLSPDDPKPPDPDVSAVLREHGVAPEPPTGS